MNTKVKKIGAVAIASALVVGAFALGGALKAPEQVTVEKLVSVEKVVEVAVAGPTVFVDKVVEVESKDMDAVLQAIYDNEGSVEFVTEDLKDSEVAQIADRFVLVNDFKALALEEVKANLADLVDKEIVANVSIDDKDVGRVRLNDEANEIVVDDIDFDDKDATLLVSGTFEAEDVKYEFEVSVDIKDGEVDDSSLESLDLA